MLTMEYFKKGVLLNFPYERTSLDHFEAWFQFLYLMNQGLHPTWTDEAKSQSPLSLDLLVKDLARRMTLNMDKAEKIEICGENSKAKVRETIEKAILPRAEFLVADIVEKVAAFKKTDRYREIIEENRLREARKFAVSEYEKAVSKMSVAEIERLHGEIRVVPKSGLDAICSSQKRIKASDDEAA